MLLVVFGAGASYDSDPYNRPDYDPSSRIEQLREIEEHRPPLANRLFDHRPQFAEVMGRFPECKPLIPHLRRAGVAVEQELARFQSEADSCPGGYSQLAAIRYYLRVAIWECQIRWTRVHAGVTNYLTFLDELERWRSQNNESICFVTFNYDTMLEEAMQQRLGLYPLTMDSYCSWTNYSLFKLHGSVNWGRVVHGMRSEGHQPVYFFEQLIRNSGRELSPAALGAYHLCDLLMSPIPNAGEVLYPALSIPLHQKDEFSCPKNHVTAMEQMLPKVTKMITIGWRGAEEEFLRTLKSARTVPTAGFKRCIRLLAVTASEQGVEETVCNIRNNGGTTHGLFVEFEQQPHIKGFSGLIDSWQTLRTFLTLGDTTLP